MAFLNYSAEELLNDPVLMQEFVNNVQQSIEEAAGEGGGEGDTYSLDGAVSGSTVTFTLDAESGTDSSIGFTAGTGMSFTYNTNTQTITFNATGSDSEGNYIIVDTTTGEIKEGENTFQYLYRYLHVRFSASSNGENFVTDPAAISGNTIYIGLANRSTTTAPTETTDYNWTEYTWSSIRNVFYRKTGGNRIEFLTSLQENIDNAVKFVSGDSPLDFNVLEINTGNIVDSAITTTKIGNDQITTPKIFANAITADKIAADAVTATKIDVDDLSAISADLGTITAGTIDASQATINNINASNITSGTLAAGRLSTTTAYISDSAMIGNSVIVGTNLQDSEIGSTKIAGGAVTASAIATGAVTADAINVSNLAAISANMGTITAGNISAGLITSGTLNASRLALDGQYITTNTDGELILSDEAVDTAQLANDAVSNAKISTGAVDSDSIALNSIAAKNIAAGAITADAIAAGTITGDKIKSSTITTGNISFTPVLSDGTNAPNSLKNSQISINANGTLSNAGGGAVSLNGLGAGDLATEDSVDLNGSEVTGTLPTTKAATGLQNSQISINANGTLSNAGGGQVSLSGLGAGDLATLNSISSTYIDANAVTTPKINAGAVDTAQLAAGAITANKIDATSAVITQSIQVGDSVIDTDSIQTNAITAAKIAAEAVTADAIKAGTITGDKINATTVIARTVQSSNYDPRNPINGDGPADAGYSLEAGNGIIYAEEIHASLTGTVTAPSSNSVDNGRRKYFSTAATRKFVDANAGATLKTYSSPNGTYTAKYYVGEPIWVLDLEDSDLTTSATLAGSEVDGVNASTGLIRLFNTLDCYIIVDNIDTDQFTSDGVVAKAGLIIEAYDADDEFYAVSTSPLVSSENEKYWGINTPNTSNSIWLNSNGSFSSGSDIDSTGISFVIEPISLSNFTYPSWRFFFDSTASDFVVDDIKKLKVYLGVHFEDSSDPSSLDPADFVTALPFDLEMGTLQDSQVEISVPVVGAGKNITITQEPGL